MGKLGREFELRITDSDRKVLRERLDQLPTQPNRSESDRKAKQLRILLCASKPGHDVMSGGDIAQRMGCTKARVYRVIKAFNEKGGLASLDLRRGRKPDEDDNVEIRASLRLLCEEFPNATQKELSELLNQHYGIERSPQRVGHYLRLDGLTRRKKGKRRS